MNISLSNQCVIRHGKTTLLQHLAKRVLNIPANIDVLLCEQEVKADETTAVRSVLNSDVKRVKLEEEVTTMTIFK